MQNTKIGTKFESSLEMKSTMDARNFIPHDCTQLNDSMSKGTDGFTHVYCLYREVFRFKLAFSLRVLIFFVK